MSENWRKIDMPQFTDVHGDNLAVVTMEETEGGAKRLRWECTCGPRNVGKWIRVADSPGEKQALKKARREAERHCTERRNHP